MATQDLIVRYQAVYGQLRTVTAARVGEAWARFGGPSDDNIEGFLAAVLPLVQGAEVATVRLVAGYMAAMARDLTGTGIEAAIDIGAVTGTALRGVAPAEVYTRPIITMRAALAAGKPYPDAFRIAQQRASITAETDVMLAQRAATLEVVQQDDRIVGYRRVLTGRSCAFCATASTQRYRTDNLMPIHANCIPTGSVVSATHRPLAVTRRLYAGELMVVTTAAGDEISITPNHPVLTQEGWLPADLVCVGDDVFRGARGHRAVGSRPDEGQRPALIEDVWRSLLMQGRLVRMPLASEDFHGDGTDGEVDVVWADGDLSPVRDGEPTSELCLVPGHGFRSAFPTRSLEASRFEGERPAPHGIVGSSRLHGTFPGGHLRCSEQPRIATATRFDPPGKQFTLESAPVYAKRGVDLVRRLSGQIEPDRIVQLRRVSFRGHVFNLYTAEGWYVANNHIVSNCDCGVAPIFGTHDPGNVINRGLLRELKATAKAGGGNRAYWDQRHVTVEEDGAVNLPEVKVHEHGELGPVLTDATHDFTGPSQVAP